LIFFLLFLFLIVPLVPIVYVLTVITIGVFFFIFTILRHILFLLDAISVGWFFFGSFTFLNGQLVQTVQNFDCVFKIERKLPIETPVEEIGNVKLCFESLHKEKRKFF